MFADFVSKKKKTHFYESFGATGGIRTPDLPVRSRTLYPAKLQLQVLINYKMRNEFCQINYK